MLHKMKLQNGPFEMIKCGRKTIEMRLLDDKRKKINIGDIIEFVNQNNNEIIKAKVIDLHKFNTFEELYANFDKVTLGYEDDEEAIPYDMQKYYDKEKIDKYGVIGIEIEMISNKQNVDI